MEMLPLFLFLFVSISFSFLCSIWEAVILSITPSYINRKTQEGNAIGPQLQALKRDIDKPLAAILTLNTIAHTVGAIGVGAQAGRLYGSQSLNLGIASLSYESIVAGAMTLAILLLSEIIPKTIGANMWKRLAPFTANSLKLLLGKLSPLRPFVWLSEKITKSLKKEKGRSVLSRADFAAMASVGLESGAIDQSESTIIQNLLRLKTLQIKDIMTPRSVMVMAEETQRLSEFYEENKPLRFSRIPIYKEKNDHITGFILKDDLLLNLAEDHHEKRLNEIRRPLVFVQSSDPLPKLLDTLVQQGKHIAIVIDTYGTVVGLVSMEDLFETILGLEIVDESDTIDDLQQFARKQWEERAKRLGLLE